MSRRLSAWLPSLVAGLVSSLLALGLQLGGWLDAYELKSMDLLMRLRGEAPADPGIVIADIDSSSVDRLGQWPWPRHLLAELIDRLSAEGAKVIAFDVVFSEPDRGGSQEDEALGTAIRRAGNVVLGYYFRREGEGHGARRYGGDSGNIADSAIEQVIEPPGGFPIPPRATVEPNIDLLAAAAASQGFFSIDPDADGVLRHYAVVSLHAGAFYPALAVRAVQRALGAGPLALAPWQGRLPELTLAGRQIPTDEVGRLWVNYRRATRAFPAVPIADILERVAPAGVFRDRIVFVGASETGLADLRATPLASVVPGVQVHATVADNLLNGRFIHDTAVHLGVSLAALLLIGPLVGLLVPVFHRPLIGSGAAAVVVFGWLLACWLAFARLDAHLQIVHPFLAGALAYVAASVYQGVFVDAKARRIRKTFEKYVSGAVVEEMLRDPDRVVLGGERREMTVLFSDIRGFTTISEKMDPEQVVRFLNQFLTPMTRIVLEAGGTLDKYMGDALMAFFGAPIAQPDHAARACRAALAMRDELARLNQQWRTDADFSTLSGPRGPGVGIGIGINSGWMAVGNMGSEAVFDYTVIGDNVNLASRLEALNRLYDTQIIASEFTVAAAGNAFLFRELDRVRVKGKETPVSVHQLIGPAPGDAEVLARLKVFTAAQTAYRARDFAGAEALLVGLVRDGQPDGPAEFYLQRCRRYALAPPGPEWDAVETLAAK